jgi:hypothetical protein
MTKFDRLLQTLTMLIAHHAPEFIVRRVALLVAIEAANRAHRSANGLFIDDDQAHEEA